MTDQTPEQAALAISARIAHALDEQWARCRCTSQANRGIPNDYPCELPRGHGGRHRNTGASWDGWADPLPPALAEAQAEWAAAGGDPERGPALSGRSADGRVEWQVDGPTYIRVRVGAVAMEYADGIWGRGWYPVECRSFGSAADWAECVRLMAAADGGAP